MSKYILELEGNFKKGECKSCFLSYLEPMMEHGEIIGYESACVLWANFDNCPLEEVKQGEWMVNCILPHNGTVGNWKCTICKGVSLKNSNFCPNCGTPMKEVSDEGDSF